nr:MerR family transcriptional regulator [Pseudoclavibacter sp. Marseille-Q3772]
MRISHCAELTGTTVRTIRYYHQVGLLPVPETRHGRRDYRLEHVSRILRIRWLAEAGLSLDAIAELLTHTDIDQRPLADTHPNAQALRELRATADAIDDRIETLSEQRKRIGALITMAEAGRSFSPMPDVLGQFYDRVAERLDDPDAIDALRKEQRIAEMFAQRGLVTTPDAVVPLFDALSDYDVDRIVYFYTRYARIPRLDASEAAAVSAELRDLVNTWAAENPGLTESTLALLPNWSRTGLGRRLLFGFILLVADHPAQAKLVREIFDDLLTRPESPSPSPSVPADQSSSSAPNPREPHHELRSHH